MPITRSWMRELDEQEANGRDARPSYAYAPPVEPHRCSDATCQECRTDTFADSGEECAYCGQQIMLGEYERSVVHQGARLHGLCARQVKRYAETIEVLRGYELAAEILPTVTPMSVEVA